MNETVQKPLILTVDDELAIRKLAKLTLEAGGFRTIEAENGNEAMQNAASYRPDVILLDINLPDMTGLEVLKRLREWFSKSILMLSVVNDEQTIVKALDFGADDYVTKPFGARELLARIRVCLRHQIEASGSPSFSSGGLTVNLADREVFFQGVRIKLTVTEYDLLRILVQHAGKVVTHKQIVTGIWGPRAPGQIRNIRVHITRLRQKIESDPETPRLLLTEPGVGYRLEILDNEAV